MKNNRYIIPLFALTLLAACDSGDRTQLPAKEKSRVEVSAAINTEANTRSSLDGTAFVAGDSFILYEGAPSDDALSACYVKSGSGWTGDPWPLYWDDLAIWNASGKIEDPTKVKFTAVLANGGALTLAAGGNSFAVAEDQRLDEAGFLRNDLLVAYGKEDASTPSNRAVRLSFRHVMARLTVTIDETDTNDDSPAIMGTSTTLTIDGAKTGNVIAFDAAAQTTVVTASGDPAAVAMRNTSSDNGSYTYEVILPAQDLSSAIIAIGNNENGKTYYFALGSVTVEGNKDLLQQDCHTRLGLKIKKTGIETGAISITEWRGMWSSAEAYPDDYPELELGGGDGGEEDDVIDPADDYAGKTIKLTGDIDAEQLTLPIGTKAVPFRGTFDGQGYTIKNVDLSGTKDDAFMGVFGYTDGATIRNLNVEGVGIKNNSESTNTATGGLAGYVNNTLIENCHVLEYTGGVTSTYDNAGGLVGYVNGVTEIRNCSACTDVTGGHDYTGGFIGRGNENMLISQCFSTGIINSSSGSGYYVGGFAGYTKGGTIEYCYTWGSVISAGARYAGGFIGRAVDTELTNSYTAGRTLTAGTPQGGLIGYSESSPQRCYWNAALAGGQGAMGNTPGSSNSSFTLLKTEAAMGTVLNGLNRTADNGSVSIWKLDRDKEDDYVLPVLVNNPGKAEPTEED